MDAAEALTWAKANPARVVTGLWAINFFLNITGILTFRGQSVLSLALAAASVIMIVRANNDRE